MTTRFVDHLPSGTFAGRPDPTTVPVGTLYAADDGTIYQSDGTAWSTWFGATTSATRTINAQTSTSYTLALADAGAFVTLDNAAAVTLTVPTDAAVAFPVGTYIEGAQLGAGQVTITPDTGVTVNADPGLNVAAQYGTFGLLKIAADTWLAMGRLSA